MNEDKLEGIINSDDTEILEAEVAKEVQNVVDVDIKELDYYEKEIGMLNLEVSMAKSINKLEEIEVMFENIKIKLKEIITNYKNIDLTNIDLNIKDTIGNYINEHRNDYIIAKVTHKVYDIPEVIRRIIGLEEQKENIEESINQKKISLTDPSKKWESFEAQKFNVDSEVHKMESTFNQQTIYLGLIKKNIVDAQENEQITTHLKGIEDMSRKTNIGATAFCNAPIEVINIIGMSVTIGMIDNLVKGIETVATLSSKDSYINIISYGEEIKNNTNDFDLIIAILKDAIINLKETSKKFMNTFDTLKVEYPVINSIEESIEATKSLLEDKLILIDKKNKEIKSY